MLEKLLELIKNGETTSPSNLANQLGVSTSMVQAMLDTLERQGYLRSVNTQCDPKKTCESCSLAGLCSTHNGSNAKIYLEMDFEKRPSRQPQNP